MDSNIDDSRTSSFREVKLECGFLSFLSLLLNFFNFTPPFYEYRYWRCGRKGAVWVLRPESATHPPHHLLHVTYLSVSSSSTVSEEINHLPSLLPGLLSI